MGGNIGAKHSDKAKQTGPGYHFWQAIKACHPPTQRVFRKLLLVCWSHGQNIVIFPPFALTHLWLLDIERMDGQGSLKSGRRHGGAYQG